MHRSPSRQREAEIGKFACYVRIPNEHVQLVEKMYMIYDIQQTGAIKDEESVLYFLFDCKKDQVALLKHTGIPIVIIAVT